MKDISSSSDLFFVLLSFDEEGEGDDACDDDCRDINAPLLMVRSSLFGVSPEETR